MDILALGLDILAAGRPWGASPNPNRSPNPNPNPSPSPDPNPNPNPTLTVTLTLSLTLSLTLALTLILGANPPMVESTPPARAGGGRQRTTVGAPMAAPRPGALPAPTPG